MLQADNGLQLAESGATNVLLNVPSLWAGSRCEGQEWREGFQLHHRRARHQRAPLLVAIRMAPALFHHHHNLAGARMHLGRFPGW
jgi:hypothetical protein